MIKEMRSGGSTDEATLASLIRTRNLIAEKYDSMYPFDYWSWKNMLPFEDTEYDSAPFDRYYYVMGVDMSNYFGDLDDPELVAVGIDAHPSHNPLESTEWYEGKFDAEEYDAIISLVQGSDTMSFADAYYYGLALLRTREYDLAFSAYEFLLASQMLVDEMTDGEWFSSAVNYLTAALLSKHFRAYQELYDSLNDEDKEDEDILTLHAAYEEMIRSGTDNIILTFEPGYPL